MSVNSKMTALADAIRETTGATGLLTIDGMTTAVRGLGKHNTLYIGTAAPTEDIGVDGDIYIVQEATT